MSILEVDDFRVELMTMAGVIAAVAVSYTHLTLPTSDLV